MCCEETPEISRLSSFHLTSTAESSCAWSDLIYITGYLLTWLLCDLLLLDQFFQLQENQYTSSRSGPMEINDSSLLDWIFTPLSTSTNENKPPTTKQTNKQKKNTCEGKKYLGKKKRGLEFPKWSIHTQYVHHLIQN